MAVVSYSLLSLFFLSVLLQDLMPFQYFLCPGICYYSSLYHLGMPPLLWDSEFPFFFFFFFFFNFFYFIHLSLDLVGEKKQKDQAKIQFESEVRTPNQDLKKSGQNQTQSRFEDLLEEDSEAESRPDPNHILAFTKTNHQLPASSVYNFIVIDDMHVKRNEAENFFFLSQK